VHPGGIADNVGNRYEALWLVRHLLELIDRRAQSITIEPIGDIGISFEFAVERNDGTEWQQAKRQTSGSWTIDRMASEGVLATFQNKFADRLPAPVKTSNHWTSLVPASSPDIFIAPAPSSPISESGDSVMRVTTASWRRNTGYVC